MNSIEFKNKFNGRYLTWSIYLPLTLFLLIFYLTIVPTKAQVNINDNSLRISSPDTTQIIYVENPDSVQIEESDSTEINEEISDSTASEEEVSDSADTDDTVDSSDVTEEENKPWSFDAGDVFKSQQLQNGVLNNFGKPVNVLSAGLSHEAGIYADVDATKEFGSDKFISSWTFGFGYDFELNDWFNMGIGFRRSEYTTEASNIYSLAKNEVSLSADLFVEKIVVDLSYQLKFGLDVFHYIGLTAMRSFKVFDFMKILPVINAQYSHFTLDLTNATTALSKEKIEKLIKNFQNNGKKEFKFTQNGLSSIGASLKFTFLLNDQFSIFLTPSITYPPMDKTLKKKVQWTASLGLSYTLDF